MGENNVIDHAKEKLNTEKTILFLFWHSFVICNNISYKWNKVNFYIYQHHFETLLLFCVFHIKAKHGLYVEQRTLIVVICTY